MESGVFCDEGTRILFIGNLCFKWGAGTAQSVTLGVGPTEMGQVAPQRRSGHRGVGNRA
jgi:hypothetical protein